MKVTVGLLTYNHRDTVERAIRSVLAQEVTFEYELIILDDCSTDGTREIVQRLGCQYPDIIKVLLSPQNVMSNLLITRFLGEANGEYISYLEGDDYWTSTEKLQRQVDLLDEHEHCSACFHNVNVVYEGIDRQNHLYHEVPRSRFSGIESVLESCFLPTGSVVFRREAVGTLPDAFLSLPVGDWPLFLHLVMSGQIAYIDEVFGVYRRHPDGLWSQLGTERQLTVNLAFYAYALEVAPPEYRRKVQQLYAHAHIRLARFYLREGDIERAKAHARTSIRLGIASGTVGSESLDVFVMLHMPRMYQRLRRSRLHGRGLWSVPGRAIARIGQLMGGARSRDSDRRVHGT